MDYAYIKTYDGIISWDGKAGKETRFDYYGLFIFNEVYKMNFESVLFIVIISVIFVVVVGSLV